MYTYIKFLLTIKVKIFKYLQIRSKNNFSTNILFKRCFKPFIFILTDDFFYFSRRN